MAICSIALLILGETCHLKGRDMVTVWRTVLLLSGYYCDSTHQHYHVTQFEYVLWCNTMHEWVMDIHYETWIAQGRFTNMILTPSKQWGVCDKGCKTCPRQRIAFAVQRLSKQTTMVQRNVSIGLFYSLLFFFFNLNINHLDLLFIYYTTRKQHMKSHMTVWVEWLIHYVFIYRSYMIINAITEPIGFIYHE